MSLEEIVKKDYVENDPTLCFKTTPIWKIVVLSLLSGGFYFLILFYNYWKTLRYNFGYEINSFFRAWFMSITNFSLFPIFDKYFRCFGERLSVPCWFAFLFFVLCIISSALDRITWRMEELNATYWGAEGLNFIISILIILMVVFIQSKINKVNKEYFPNAPVNGWTVANTVWTVVLGLLNLLGIIISIFVLALSAVE